MTQRERHASTGLSATVAAPIAVSPSAAATLTAPRLTAPEGSAAKEASWEELYRGVPPDRQQELLSLADRQGLLYAHQLPAATNGSHPPAQDQCQELRLLSQALAGQVDAFSAFTPAPVTLHDAALDATQREAVARALATPDLCLIQGLPGTGKSRVVAEIVTQAAGRGDRVLLLAPCGAALDRVLELVRDRDVLCPIRCLGRDERPEQLPPATRAVTLHERTRALRDHTLRAAVQSRQHAEQRCHQRRREELLWPRLQALAEEFQGLCVQAETLARERGRVPEEVRQLATAEHATGEVPAFKGKLIELVRTDQEAMTRVDAGLTDAAKQQTQQRQERTTVAGELAALRPLAQAKQQGRWWSPLWWQATFRGDVVSRVAELDKQQQTLDAALAKLEQDHQTLTRQRADAAAAFQRQHAAIVDAEIAGRLGDLDRQRGHLERHQAQLRQHWQTVSTGLEPEYLPGEMTTAAVEAAGQRWQAQTKVDEETCRFATQWAVQLEENLEALAARLPLAANLVAATTAGLPTSEFFADPATPAGRFDLLVLEEADQVTESEFLKAARRARRWVLVGEPGPADSPNLARTAVFHRLWHHLHCNPSRLPYTWQREQGGLCCRLRPVLPEQRQRLERESLADFPEIELRILALPRVPPVLAEVVFPPSLSVSQAKDFIYRELQELTVQAQATCLRWREDADRLTVCLSDHATPHGAPVELEAGVREVLGRTGDRDGQAVPAWTCHLEFDRAAGWTRSRAEDWLHSHLNVRDLNRTALLETPHRMTPPLAALLSDGLLATPYHLTATTDGTGPALEFIVVPPAQRKRETLGGSRDGDRRKKEVALPRSGAGLELDLSTARPGGDRLPAELRAALPARGLVNYFEAQTVVRKLEELFAAPQKPASVGVLALYPAQVELIRQLVRRCPKLAGVALVIDVPAEFRHQEFDVVIVSLTRSHSHRAVPYGDSPASLLLALTRARRRLVLVGDPGTLARRVQWQGALDHLDDAAAATEVRLLGNLLRLLNGQGRHPDACQLTEGSGA